MFGFFVWHRPLLTIVNARPLCKCYDTFMQLRNCFIVLAALISLCPLRGSAAGQIHEVTGVVRQAMDNTGQIRIAHDDIPGVMPAMTMAFQVTPPQDAAGLQPGDRVKFKLHTSTDGWFASSFVLLGHETPAPGSTSVASAARRLREGDLVPEFSLLNQDDIALTTAALRGHWTVLTFIFTRCPVPDFCPLMTRRFGDLQKSILADPALAARARLLSITLDPAYDRPAVLKAYGEAAGADFAVWQFATGTDAAITALTKAFAVYTERNGVTLDHTLCTALIGPDGRVVQIWRGNGWKTGEILAALQPAPAS